jgi:hypothetical protein
MANKKGAPKRRPRAAAAASVRFPDVELGAGGGVDVVRDALARLLPLLAPALIERISKPSPAAPAAEGRLIRIETQLGYLSNGHHALDNRTKALAAEVEELRQRLAAVERH